ncbi:MAG TPA: nickel transporter permease [Thermodesulfobacteriota bacterium]|nr:nickel transporter permease [Thermodesulfobacteriota bacterium]
MKRAVRHFFFNPLSLLGILFIGVLLFTGILAPLLAPYDPIEISPDRRLTPPNSTNWLGTDEVGRDILSRIIHGARISLEIGVTIVFFAAVIGLVIGLVSGFSGGILDQTLMRFTDMFMSFPTLILAIAMTAALGPSLFNAVLAMIIVWWPIYARLIRGEVLAVKEKEYIRAIRALGARPFKIIFFHVLPNTIDVVVIRASIDFGNAVMFCAALSFIGLGAQPPQPEWGAMVTTGRDYLRDAWWLVTFPGLAIFLTVMGFNLFGDSLRDFLDPKLRGER